MLTQTLYMELKKAPLVYFFLEICVAMQWTELYLLIESPPPKQPAN